MLTRQLDILGWGLVENFQKEFKNLRAIKLLVLFKSRQSEITWELSLDRTVFWEGSPGAFQCFQVDEKEYTEETLKEGTVNYEMIKVLEAKWGKIIKKKGSD